MNHVVLRGFASGKVQGVSYRAFARERALAEGVSGHAINCDDGRVDLLLCGEEEAVKRVILALQEGPRNARVDALELTPVDDAASGFTIG
jgi:acylphosphatase